MHLRLLPKKANQFGGVTQNGNVDNKVLNLTNALYQYLLFPHILQYFPAIRMDIVAIIFRADTQFFTLLVVSDKTAF